LSITIARIVSSKIVWCGGVDARSAVAAVMQLAGRCKFSEGLLLNAWKRALVGVDVADADRGCQLPRISEQFIGRLVGFEIRSPDVNTNIAFNSEPKTI
jgi:hypothetical protein